jgi:hypothetical protein
VTKEIQIKCAHLIEVDWLKQKIAVFKSIKQARRVVDVSDDCAGAAGIAGYAKRDDGQVIFYMILPKKPKLDTIVHESIHVVDYLLECVGIPITVQCGEVRTYMTEWLVSELCSRYKVTP